MSNQLPTPRERSSGLWAYNIRILLGNSYWLIITPIAAAQLVLFWNMAVVSMSSPARSAGTVELVAPVLAAFLCAHALAPEQGSTDELIFVRPVSIERILILRVVAIFAFILLALSPVLTLYQLRVGAFPLAMTLLATLPSMLLLSMLALGVASAVRQPLLGFAAAGAYWALDLVTRGYLNPIVSLQTYSGWLSGLPFSEVWAVNKLVLVGLAGLLYFWVRSMLGRPAAPLRLRVVAARSVLAVAIVFVYLATGAGYKLAYGLHREKDLDSHAHIWYQTQFGSYGPLPVPGLFGPAFALYLDAATGAAPTRGQILGSGATQADVSRLRSLQQRYPNSIWADNAQLLIALEALARPASRPIVLIAYEAGKKKPSRQVIGDDLDAARVEFEALVDRYPNSPFAPFALSKLAGIGLATLDLDLAISAYERLVQRYPQAAETLQAATDLSTYYLNTGEPEHALKAADLAASLSPWDVQAEALLAAARAAESAGKAEIARDRYTRARAAASTALDRAIRGKRSPKHLPKGQLFERANAVIATSKRALSGDIQPPTGLAAEIPHVTGSIRVAVSGATATRVALGTVPDATGFPSPFVSGTALSAAPGPDGNFAFTSVPARRYHVLAIALSVPRDKVTWSAVFSPPFLPIEVRGPSVEMPPISVSLAPQRVERQSSRAGRNATVRSRGRISGSGGRTRRGGGGSHR
jgi:tetratricopeptide (TPR) repeat protein